MTNINTPQGTGQSNPPPDSFHSQKKTGRKISTCMIGAFVLAGTCCLAAIAGVIGYNYFARGGTGGPVVMINTPQHGQTFTVGQQVEVQSIARDPERITRAELWVDGMLAHTETSSLAGGISPFPLLVDWQPAISGQHNLTVRAFNSRGEQTQAFVMVEAFQILDSDGDRVADESDLCPQEQGSEVANGCPDQDGDGIGDSSDACPDVAGMPDSSGCPMPAEGDGDGDGLLDAVDACPEEPGAPFADGCPDADGDGTGDITDECPDDPGLPDSGGCPIPGDADADGVPDASDACPEAPGSADTGGCADDDGDSFADADDLCPDEAGSGEHGGCPDRDLDGVPDTDDLCPDIPGSDHGCPEGDDDGGAPAEDRDGDGLHDGIDLCPDESGTVENAGCPPPADDPGSDGDGFIEDAGDLFDILPEEAADSLIPEAVRVEPVEFQALSFELANERDTLTCYVGLSDAGVERLGPYELEGQRTWDLVNESIQYGGSTRTIMVPFGELLVVQVECGGETIGGYEEGGSWGVYYNLGNFIARHTPEDWDGHVITQSSIGGDAGESFQASYRICRGSCEQAEFPPPILSLFHYAGNHQLIWLWDGNRENIDGFNVYVNGNPAGNLSPTSYSHSVRYFEPACGRRNEFTLTAYRGTRESPPSNTAFWSGETCPRQLRISFEKIQPGSHWESCDEYDLRECQLMGSIYGHFNITASGETTRINFDAASFGWEAFLMWPQGRKLLPNSEEIIPELFDWIHTQQASCLGAGCPSYSASESPFATIQLEEGDDLTLGGVIKDYDIWTSDDTLFNANRTLRWDEIIPGEYTLSNRNITLMIRIDDVTFHPQ